MTTPYHVGILVADLSQAIGRHRDEGVTFHDPVTVRMDASEGLYADGARVLDVAFSTEGPTHLELIQATDAAPLFSLAERQPGLHHVAYWQDDVAAHHRRLTARGVEDLGRLLAPSAAVFGWFARFADGLVVEYVDASGKWAFDKYIASGHPKYLTLPT